MNSSIFLWIHHFFGLKKEIRSIIRGNEEDSEQRLIQCNPPCCSDFIFLHERNPRTTTSSPCGSAGRDDPSSGSNVYEVSTSLCSPFFSEGNIVYWTALYFKYMEILWDMWHSFLFHRAAKKDVLGFQKRNTTMPIFIWHMLAPMFCTKNCYTRYFYVK